jgi:chloramphenicol O-acetyltransferase type B
MFKDYFDPGFLANPLGNYIKWLLKKTFYQTKNWGKHLRISYMANVSNTIFGKYNWIGKGSYIANSVIGDFTYITENSVILESNIGKFCSIGPNVRIAPGKHPTSVYVSTHSSIYSNPENLVRNFVKKAVYNYDRKVVIGNDVWIGANVVIIDGITIGDGVVIAANSVVTKNVLPYLIIGGTPAKPIKKRFEDSEIEFLLHYQWWNKPEKFIQENISIWWSIKDFMNEFK